MQIIIRILVCVLAIGAAADVVCAADLRGSTKDTPAHLLPSVEAPASWTGFYVGASVGYGHTVLSDDDGSGGLDLSGIFGGLRAGGDIQRGSVVFGAWGEYNWDGQELKLLNTTLIEQTDDWNINARIGFAQDRTLLYAFGGYGQAFFKSGTTEADAPLWRAGVGIEHKLTAPVSISLEYAHSWLDADELLGEGAEDVVDLNEDRIMGVLRYRFGGESIRSLTGN